MIKIRVPSQTANLCIGFDSLGLALDIYNEFTFNDSDQLIFTGCDKEFQNEENLLYRAVRHTCEVYKREVPKFKVDFDTKIPVARGLGSSASLTVAGVSYVNYLYNLNLSKLDILKLATDLEGHPDNAAPAIMGGLCVSKVEENDIISKRIEIANWHFMVIIPRYEVKTRDARAVLPSEIKLHNSALQVANGILTIEALKEGDEKLLYRSAIDYLHEPYRNKLIKEYGDVKIDADKLGLSLFISGSGPTMISLSMDDDKLLALKDKLKDLELDIYMVNMDKEGVKING